MEGELNSVKATIKDIAKDIAFVRFLKKFLVAMSRSTLLLKTKVKRFVFDVKAVNFFIFQTWYPQANNIVTIYGPIYANFCFDMSYDEA